MWWLSYEIVIDYVLNYKKNFPSFHTYITRITTFIKTKFKKSDDQTNIKKYRVAANITEHHNTHVRGITRVSDGHWEGDGFNAQPKQLHS